MAMRSSSSASARTRSTPGATDTPASASIAAQWPQAKAMLESPAIDSTSGVSASGGRCSSKASTPRCW
jgi:hypothetical protein